MSRSAHLPDRDPRDAPPGRPLILGWWSRLFELPASRSATSHGKSAAPLGGRWRGFPGRTARRSGRAPAVPAEAVKAFQAILGGRARAGRDINSPPPVIPRTKALRSEQMRWFLVLVLVLGLAIGGAFATGLISIGGNQPSGPAQTCRHGATAAARHRPMPLSRPPCRHRQTTTTHCGRQISPRPGR